MRFPPRRNQGAVNANVTTTSAPSRRSEALPPIEFNSRSTQLRQPHPGLSEPDDAVRLRTRISTSSPRNARSTCAGPSPCLAALRSASPSARRNASATCVGTGRRARGDGVTLTPDGTHESTSDNRSTATSPRARTDRSNAPSVRWTTSDSTPPESAIRISVNSTWSCSTRRARSPARFSSSATVGTVRVRTPASAPDRAGRSCAPAGGDRWRLP